ncbi:hypothetical protein MP638_002628 [Amoeboaphelidium occidentale]|nr:hypothetical protein MP638_002628 [Amoeboaphelidium occidentale]
MKLTEQDILNQYLRFRDLNFERWSRDYQPTSKVMATLIYIVSVHGIALIQCLFFLFETFIFVFLIPGSFGQKYFYPSMVLDPAIPKQASITYTYLAATGMLLFLKIFYNLGYQGYMNSMNAQLTLGTVMTNRYVRRIITFTSLTKWRYIKHMSSQMSSTEQIIGWILFARDEWKRFLTLKTLVFVVSCIQIYLVSTKKPVYKINKIIHLAFIAYWSLKIVIYACDAINKIAALITYFYKIKAKRAKDILSGGMSMEAFYQMQAGSVAMNMTGSETIERTAAQRQFEPRYSAFARHASQTESLPVDTRPHLRIKTMASEQDDGADHYGGEQQLQSASIAPLDENESVSEGQSVQDQEESPLPYRQAKDSINGQPLVETDSQDDEVDDGVPPWMRYTLMTDLTRASNPHGL